jgi:hypothetical protein
MHKLHRSGTQQKGSQQFEKGEDSSEAAWWFKWTTTQALIFDFTMNQW